MEVQHEQQAAWPCLGRMCLYGHDFVGVAVMARLADYSNDEGLSWPAVETIRRQIGAKSESTVKSAIAELEKDGWLTKRVRKAGGRNLSNIYQINVEKLEAAAAAAREAYRPKRKVNRVKTDPSNF